MKKAALGSLLLGSLLFSTIAYAQTAPSVSVTGGNTPYAHISVSGAGFTPSEVVHVMLGLNGTNVTADAMGSFSGANLTIPNFPSGLYLVIAIGQTSGLPAFTYLYVNSLYPQASPSSWFIAPGSTLTWSGYGFVPNEPVTVADASGATVATFTTDASGSFSNTGSSTVPFALRNSTATYTLSGGFSHVHTTFHISVADLYPYVTPSSWYTTPGSQLTFSGASFGANEGVSVYLGTSTTPLAHVTANTLGSFTLAGPVMIPFKTSSVIFRLVGDLSGATAMAPISLASFYPTLIPSAYYAAPGSFISLTGSGFVPNEVVDVVVGAMGPVTATANNVGTFTVPALHIPTIPNTPVVMSATGEQSGASANFTMAVGSYYSWVTADTYWAQGGSPLTIFGHNFAAGETVTITSASSTLGTVVVAHDGTFTAPVSVPFAPSGPAIILATGALSGATAQVILTVAPVYTDLQLGSYAGAPGVAVEFKGHGYLPNENITVTTDRTGVTPVTTFTTNATGDFDNSSFIVPAGFIEGTLTLTVLSEHSFNTKSVVYYVTGI